MTNVEERTLLCCGDVMDDQLADYLISYYPHLLLPEERLALRNTHANMKIEATTSEFIARRLRLWLVDDSPEVFALLADGATAFRHRTAERLLKEENIVLNRCPKCEGLARTPRAKQCPHCFHDWH